MALHQVTYRHHAMATSFSLSVMHADAKYARQAAAAACGELEMLEQHLSRFRDDSDVARIGPNSQGPANTNLGRYARLPAHRPAGGRADAGTLR